MGASYSDNLGAVLTALAADLPTEEHTVTWANVMEYAHWLHDRHAYFVFNPNHAAQTVRKNLAEVKAAGMTLDDETIRNALDKAGFEEVNWLLEKGHGTQPAVKGDADDRSARQGGWADITGMLAASYRHMVDGEEVRDHGELVPPPSDEEDRPAPLSFP